MSAVMEPPQTAAAPDEAARFAHAHEVGALAARLASDPQAGISAEEAQSRRSRFGPNQLAEEPPTPLWRRFLDQFKEIVIWILIAAAIIAGVMQEFVDAIAILAIVLLNGVIGFMQELRAEQALAALRKLSAPIAKVVRGGQLVQIPAAELVPGDRIELEAGDHVPADARLITAYGLQVQESALTGESTPVEKEAGLVLPEQTALGDRRNLMYLGTVVVTGKAAALVVATGMQTELGKIAGLLSRQPPEQTPLQRRLAELGRTLVVVCLALVAIVFVLQWSRHGNLLEVFMVSVSLAVAAVPEGLPAVVTLALALGLQRMAARNALVRKLPSVESLGSVTVICTDKTGTLTRNEMTVRKLVVGGEQLDVSGSGYQPEGQFHRGGDEKNDAVDVAKHDDVRLLLTAGVRCNGARLERGKEPPHAWTVIGDPTEGALLVAAKKGGLEISRKDFEVLSEIPFDSNRKAMSVIVREDRGEVIYTKGAPEVVLGMCSRERTGGQDRPLTGERRQAILKQSAALADEALRVLALAYRPSNGGEELKEADLTLVGLAGMIDPPRDEARPAVESCHTAGIKAAMITGDHPATARAIARELGILADGDEVLTGQELEQQSDDELTKRVERISVYARVSAEHKLRVVKAWQRRGQIVAMTGDGVNDAPAVKAADIGIAMGQAGSDVTKEASDMVLTDDNFRSIVSAVEEGRSIFANVRNIVHYLLACNAGEVLFMFFAAAIGWKVPLAAVQILWINLVTDGLPALALAMEKPEADAMRRPPRPPHEPVLTFRRGGRIILHGLLVASATAVAFWLVHSRSGQFEEARTAAFCVLAFSQLLFSFACRSERHTLLELGPFSNPYLLSAIVLSALLQLGVVLWPFAQHVLQVQASLNSNDWLIVLVAALAPVTLVELAKLVLAPFRRDGGPKTAR